MKAHDIMIRDVLTVTPETSVTDAIKLLSEHDISALPVVDANGNLVGILSEADLLERAEDDAHPHRWWVEALMPSGKLAEEFIKAHGKKVSEVMSTHVVTAGEDTSVPEIAALLERHRIKRVPIVANGKIVGIISRSNLIQALASSKLKPEPKHESDRTIRLDLLDRLGHQHWTHFGSRNIIVENGVVHLWGLVGSEAERKALIELAQEVRGVSGVADEMIPVRGRRRDDTGVLACLAGLRSWASSRHCRFHARHHGQAGPS